MAVGIFVNYQTPSQGISFPVDGPTTVELRVLSNLIQSLLGNGTQAPDELRVLRNDQTAQGN